MCIVSSFITATTVFFSHPSIHAWSRTGDRLSCLIFFDIIDRRPLIRTAIKMNPFGGSSVQAKPPEKGSFPLDRAGEVRKSMPIDNEGIHEWRHNNHICINVYTLRMYDSAVRSHMHFCRVLKNIIETIQVGVICDGRSNELGEEGFWYWDRCLLDRTHIGSFIIFWLTACKDMSKAYLQCRMDKVSELFLA